MATVPSGDITTLPAQKVVFNAPFDTKHTYYMKIINSGGHRIGFVFKTNNLGRLSINPANGVLDPKQKANIAISCEAFDAAVENIVNDRVSLLWANAPESAKSLPRDWFKFQAVTSRRKNLEYNM